MDPLQRYLAMPSQMLPIYAFVICCVVYLFGRVLLSRIHNGKRSLAPGSRWDQAEKGSLEKQGNVPDVEIFQLEKRAFFSKTWLFVCHRSRFSRPGDYHVFDVAEISFFVVLGKDQKVRAFHNVCRHRAYTVVRKSCGNSTRFSCKYHGWQYDDKGALIKAPKFDESRGFVPEDNGLFEAKLITTREGFVFVNFDASTMNLPFNNVKSHVELGNCAWVDGIEVTCGTNWKDIANEFLNQAQWSQTSFGWFSRSRKTKVVELLGPVSLIKELDDDMWCTMVILPRSSSQVIVRGDLYGKEGHVAPVKTVEKWKWMLKQEVVSLSKSDARETDSKASKYFAYRCGGRTIDLFAILAQHQRSEKLAKRKVQPAIRLTGTADIDAEAEALCDALDGVADSPTLEKCSRKLSFPHTVEW
ncbi:hypothetical protein H2200_006207 [Cladophialophora chaetospira]|uniref:Rieske domain-containing protein n=1 Tax=Cladophialophora chaetospira TaxID=386627 RepID=A0AA38XAM1_9EURO|nr:hypothetical protein H2200_006207 [Cladophialophora chaetospira]